MFSGAFRPILCMKKLFLLSTVLLGAIPASQAGVSFNVGIGLPLPVPLPFIIHRPAPVYVAPAPAVCAPAPVYAPASVCVGPPRVVVVPPPCYQYYYPHRHGVFVHRGWERPYGYRY